MRTSDVTRYAVYFAPDGAFGDHGAAWLGWDIHRGSMQDHPAFKHVNLASVTQKPRRYGFHATIKAPFGLHKAHPVADLKMAFEDLCTSLAPVSVPALETCRLGQFLGLIPTGSAESLRKLAGRVVMELDVFRAPATAQEIEKRRKARLTRVQEAHLSNWGYPFVMDEFKFHMTLTGRIKEDADLISASRQHFDPVLPKPLVVSKLALVGEAQDGFFHVLNQCELTGTQVQENNG